MDDSFRCSSSGPTPKIGLGCVTFGREVDESTSFAMLEHAVAHGIRFFDTAAAYGNGASEAILGRWLSLHQAERAEFTIATKLLPPYTAAGIESGVRESAARLQLETIDMLFLHQWHATASQPEVLAALASLVSSGQVRALGASNFTADQLAGWNTRQRELGAPPLRALQNVHNFANRGFDASLRRRCAKAGIALIGYSPLGAGFLTGKYRAGVAPDSRFARIPGHQPLYLNDTAAARLAQLERAARDSGLSLVALALAWALHDPEIDTVLVGGRNCHQLDQAFAARSPAAQGAIAHLNRISPA